MVTIQPAADAAGLHQALRQARQERRGRRRCLLRSDVAPRNALRSGQERGAASDADAAQDARTASQTADDERQRASRPSFGVRQLLPPRELAASTSCLISSKVTRRFRTPPGRAQRFWLRLLRGSTKRLTIWRTKSLTPMHKMR